MSAHTLEMTDEDASLVRGCLVDRIEEHGKTVGTEVNEAQAGAGWTRLADAGWKIEQMLQCYRLVEKLDVKGELG